MNTAISKSIDPSKIDRLIREKALHATQIRRRLHQIPELQYEEHQTAQIIRAELLNLGIASHLTIPNAPTATIAHIGDPSLPCVALRADIDALPIEEQNDLPYKSKTPHRMHACGHDGHTATLLGAAAVFKALEPDLPVCIKLLFQPAEEGGGGAKRIMDAGLAAGQLGPKPSVIFGLHGWPGMPVGKISTKPGPILASVDNFTATLIGKGSHGAYPHLGRDPIIASAEAIISLQHIVSREVDPTDSAVITVGQIHAGAAVNIIPERATFSGTLRALTPHTRQHLQDAVHRRLNGIAASHNLQLEISWFENYPPTINDPAIADYVRDTVVANFPADTYLPSASASMGGEDFAYYLEQIPGCFILVGLRPPGATECPGLHHPRFNYNDEALPTAIKLMVELALNARNRK